MNICTRILINVRTLYLTKKSNAVLHARQHQGAVRQCTAVLCLEDQCTVVHPTMVMATTAMGLAAKKGKRLMPLPFFNEII